MRSRRSDDPEAELKRRQKQADNVAWLNAFDGGNQHLVMNEKQLRIFLRQIRPIPPATCLAVKQRSDGRCEDCGEQGRTDFHHKTYRIDGQYIFGKETPDDVLALCRKCHTGRHFLSSGQFYLPD